MNVTGEENSGGKSASMLASFTSALRERFGNRARFDEPMSQHTSFRIGGPADVWVKVETVAELSALRILTATARQPLHLHGSGTNVLVSDRGIRGVVVYLGRRFSFAQWDEGEDRARVWAGAATPFKKLVYDAVGRGWQGLEFGEGIPGSLGGGLTMNAGAFGGELGKVVEWLEGVDEDGAETVLGRDQLPFVYRRLDLPHGFVITAVRLRLERGDRAVMERFVATARDKRKSRQPLGFPNAGSIFKNPPGMFAGQLLEEAGVKGLERAGARVSDRHANFIVNAGGTRARDVRDLMSEMRRRVRERSGVDLELEVKLLGDW